jgi:hypothetical protein
MGFPPLGVNVHVQTAASVRGPQPIRRPASSIAVSARFLNEWYVR